ncbi:MAG: Peptidoglycan-N-acetylglucosamine deacetylase [Deltaproteobacteria bacterium ADurb.Bin207]|nr:MAG: Peptidoglycan-N-acetylglucosamine deacetylase [Deltaproteobacteria bacterium ADurb.Bin207]
MRSTLWFPLCAAFGMACMTIGCSSAFDDEESPEATQDEIEAWNSAYEENASGKADSAGCSGVIVPDRNGFNKRIALTFDDGPSLANTQTVAEILEAHGTVGTFFVNGKNIKTQEHKALLKRLKAKGHIIANHTHTHVNMAQASAATVTSEIERTHSLLKELDLKPRFFRFPYGASTCATADKVRSYGYAVTGWHIDSADWCFASSTGGVGTCSPSTFKHVPNEFRSDIAGFVLSQAQAKGGGVLLFHDIHTYTVSKLDTILSRLEQNGFKFVPLSDTSTFPLLNGSAPKPSAWVGTPCTDDSQCNFTASGSSGFCWTYDDSNLGFCSLECNGYCPDKSGTAPTFCTSVDGGQTGQCVSKASEANHQCSDLPGTDPVSAQRFVGTSTASAATALVCLPSP